MIDELLTRMERIPPQILKKLLSGFLWEGTPDSDAMALTFDDGPHPDITPKVLDALDEAGISGTFFMLGENVTRYPDTAREVAGRGQFIGNHSMTHPRMVLMKRDRVESEIDEAQNAISGITGVSPKWFRPPYGMFDFTCADVVRKRGMTMVLWTVLSGDYSGDSPDRIMRTIEPFIKPGSIIVFHDTVQGGAAMLPDIIKNISNLARERNVRLAGIDELSVAPDIEIDECPDD